MALAVLVLPSLVLLVLKWRAAHSEERRRLSLVVGGLVAGTLPMVADQIRSVIEESRFAPGTRLPPERELALQLGVSRPSLREALIALEIEGIVETRMGSGVYVCAPPPVSAALESPMLGESPSGSATPIHTRTSMRPPGGDASAAFLRRFRNTCCS